MVQFDQPVAAHNGPINTTWASSTPAGTCPDAVTRSRLLAIVNSVANRERTGEPPRVAILGPMRQTLPTRSSLVSQSPGSRCARCRERMLAAGEFNSWLDGDDKAWRDELTS